MAINLTVFLIKITLKFLLNIEGSKCQIYICLLTQIVAQTTGLINIKLNSHIARHKIVESGLWLI